MCVCVVLCFFQAEDGIRDLVRSRGLGDVYKRQDWAAMLEARSVAIEAVDRSEFWSVIHGSGANVAWPVQRFVNPVSYTHLTLPTSDLV